MYVGSYLDVVLFSLIHTFPTKLIHLLQNYFFSFHLTQTYTHLSEIITKYHTHKLISITALIHENNYNEIIY